ncbi:hypothetical protein [Roseomonas elaeocarpi]|uniref:Uncharacterized protein n=1 Tax=Roseomonas elaeocarpi TaxID=907779 RepID=A0ABV6JWA4_9PROT
MALVILSPSGGPGLPEGSPEHRYEINLTLDGGGLPSAEAWQADPAPWLARRIWPGDGLSEGDVQYDPDLGWTLRFFRQPGAADDAPLHAMIQGHLRLRPGEHVTIVEPDGRSNSWRVVGVS